MTQRRAPPLAGLHIVIDDWGMTPLSFYKDFEVWMRTEHPGLFSNPAYPELLDPLHTERRLIPDMFLNSNTVDQEIRRLANHYSIMAAHLALSLVYLDRRADPNNPNSARSMTLTTTDLYSAVEFLEELRPRIQGFQPQHGFPRISLPTPDTEIIISKISRFWPNTSMEDFYQTFLEEMATGYPRHSLPPVASAHFFDQPTKILLHDVSVRCPIMVDACRQLCELYMDRACRPRSAKSLTAVDLEGLRDHYLQNPLPPALNTSQAIPYIFPPPAPGSTVPPPARVQMAPPPARVQMAPPTSKKQGKQPVSNQSLEIPVSESISSMSLGSPVIPVQQYQQYQQYQQSYGPRVTTGGSGSAVPLQGSWKSNLVEEPSSYGDTSEGLAHPRPTNPLAPFLSSFRSKSSAPSGPSASSGSPAPSGPSSLTRVQVQPAPARALSPASQIIFNHLGPKYAEKVETSHPQAKQTKQPALHLASESSSQSSSEEQAPGNTMFAGPSQAAQGQSGPARALTPGSQVIFNHLGPQYSEKVDTSYPQAKQTKPAPQKKSGARMAESSPPDSSASQGRKKDSAPKRGRKH